jgi:hypothetical protein
MKIGISQPTFLPWSGYLALIDYVDEFIFLDDVQFEKRSWHQRNYIKLQNKKFLLTVPVFSKNNRFQKISETNINYKINYVKKHIDTITHAYSKSEYFKKYSKDIFNIYDQNEEYIVNLNLKLIKYFCDILEIKTKIDFSSNLETNNKNENLIVEICKKKKCIDYISTIGAKKYLKNEKLFLDNNIKLNFYKFNYKEYNQIGKNFIENLSFLDLFFNLGTDSINYLRENFKIINE